VHELDKSREFCIMLPIPELSLALHNACSVGCILYTQIFRATLLRQRCGRPRHQTLRSEAPTRDSSASSPACNYLFIYFLLARQLCCEQVLFLAASVSASVCLSAQSLETAGRKSMQLGRNVPRGER